LLVDCDTCAVKGRACSSCVVTVLLGSTPEGIEWDETEREALGVLADSGLIPPLRLVSERLVPLGLPRRREAG